MRVHNLLTGGEWLSLTEMGSTNVYTEDASGHAVYNWEILDRIFDTFHEAGHEALVEIGFTPGQLQLLPSPGWVQIDGGQSATRFKLPRHALSLIRVSW